MPKSTSLTAESGGRLQHPLPRRGIPPPEKLSVAHPRTGLTATVSQEAALSCGYSPIKETSWSCSPATCRYNSTCVFPKLRPSSGVVPLCSFRKLVAVAGDFSAGGEFARPRLGIYLLSWGTAGKTPIQLSGQSDPEKGVGLFGLEYFLIFLSNHPGSSALTSKCYGRLMLIPLDIVIT